MPQCVSNCCPVYSGRNTTQRSGFPFCCLARRLQIPQLLLLCVTCRALCSLVQPGLEGSASLVHLFRNRSNQEQGYCETEASIASSLNFWTLSSEDLIAVLPVDPVKENYVRKVRNCIFSIAFPTPFKSRVRLAAVSKEVLEDILDLDLSVSETDAFIQLVSGEKIVFGSIPLAHRYGGHQVRIASAQFLLCKNKHLVVSDDEVWRDQFYNGNIVKERGAVVLRVAKSWFRIGSLEILAHYGELDLLRLERPLKSVCNTDNFSLLSITIDYGPFGFMEAYNPDFVPNTSDDERRYKIGNQANIGMFNLNKLLQALNPLLDPGQKQLAAQILEGYPVLYYTRFTELFKAKLGLLGERKGDDDLIAFLLHLMEKTEADFTMTFRQLSEVTQSQLQELNIPQQFWALKTISKHQLFPAWVSQYLLRLKSNMNDSDSERRKRMTSKQSF
ncbi:PREDICTED: uncharacterized protein LOC109377689 [Hipposideros armiger]|uniref:Selenoprotein O n=1 Tax=Hipposideros armiger TaxID=186990 RepID=A0A8B7QNL4_HIPAR|nr:PREDICTED: uncharacterized protein LOC109377689 [Hipposideros armiger]